ncbi:MAG: hypothetical protein HY652_01940 [Acidobacteria bacterium]|nr:hypothetical protein [Acidobacteriota bacterium]
MSTAQKRPRWSAVAAVVLAWAFPGSGHLFLKRWGRALIFCASVVALFALGLQMQGELFSANRADFFTLLKFVADVSVGLPYFVARQAGFGEGNIRSMTYEYGNTFLYVAGLLNLLIILDAYDIAAGKKA